MGNFEQFSDFEALEKAKPNFECNADHHLFFFSSTHPALLPDDAERVQVMCELVVCDDEHRPTILICNCIDEFIGGALEAVPRIAKERVAAPAHNESSVFSGLFDYSSNDYLREKYKDPENIKDPCIVKETLLYFDTVEKARAFVFEQVTKSLE